MEVLNLKSKFLRKKGFKSLSEWNSHPNHLYIGRDITHYVEGATGSKWHNPFKKGSKDERLASYEKYIRNHALLFSEIHELEGKVLGCWCHPEPCHGHVLMRLLAQINRKAKKEISKIDHDKVFNRNEYKEMAEQTMQIIKQGSYFNSGETEINIQPCISFAVENTHLFLANDQSFQSFVPLVNFPETNFSVTSESTLQTSLNLQNNEFNIPVLLNFASAKNPGGGFLRGANAQEESLARSSGLYLCLTSPACAQYYSSNQATRDGIYTDNIIYSPNVPFFRDGSGKLLDLPFSASIITAPAVNRRHARSHFNAKDLECVVSNAMNMRISKILQVAALKGHDTLVLGAWGCGVFQNEPHDVAHWFHEWLVGPFWGVFKEVVFAIQDKEEGKTIRAFRDIFDCQQRIDEEKKLGSLHEDFLDTSKKSDKQNKKAKKKSKKKRIQSSYMAM
mmetsp:Transcript_9110/g.11857  ORF Transcript_9110/g.11857 Transcript_9110/m.11857 type:complete len:449 (+) Transcript_9110:128-1474(+)